MKKLKDLILSVFVLIGALTFCACSDVDYDNSAADGNGSKLLKVYANRGNKNTRASEETWWYFDESDSTWHSYTNAHFDSGDEIGLCTSDGQVARYRTDDGYTFTPVSNALTMPSDRMVYGYYPYSEATDPRRIEVNLEEGNTADFCWGWDNVRDDNSVCLYFSHQLSPLVLKTYADKGVTPLEIVPKIDITEYSSNIYDVIQGNFVEYEGSYMGLEKELKPISVDEPQDDYRPDGVPKEVDTCIYKFYGGDTLRPCYLDKLKYTAYGIFNVEKSVWGNPSKGVKYEMSLKLPRTASVERNFAEKKATIKLFLPEGCKLDEACNINDYGVGIICDDNDPSWSSDVDVYKRWDFDFPATLTDTLVYEVELDDVAALVEKNFFMEIYKKNYKYDFERVVYQSGALGNADVKVMDGSWDSIEKWYNYDKGGILETDTATASFSDFGIGGNQRRCSTDRPWNYITGTWYGSCHMFINDYDVTIIANYFSSYIYYVIQGKINDCVNPTRLSGTQSLYYRKGEEWVRDYKHDLEMKKRE